MRRRTVKFKSGFFLVASVLALSAQAHHVMGGTLPQTFIQGLLSGLGHPVIGLDHAAFIICTGFVCALLERGLWGVAALIAGTLLGTGLHLAGVTLPASEAAVALSVMLIGGLLLSRRAIPAPGLFGGLALAGIFHGYAYGESIVGAETAALGAYLLGFSLLQWGLATGAWFVHRRLIVARVAFEPRVCTILGAASGIIGAGFLLGNFVSV